MMLRDLAALALITVSNAPGTRCGNCGCTFGQPYPRDRHASPHARPETCFSSLVVTDFRTDVLCGRCRASFNWEPDDWHVVNDSHVVRIDKSEQTR